MLAHDEIIVRPGNKKDLPFLREMLFEAAFWRPDQERPSLEEGLEREDLSFLLDDWGRQGDAAVIALEQDGCPIGAAWCRFWGPEQHSYGYISPEIPELGIAVRQSYRGLGIGHLLVEALLLMAAEVGIEKVSLSVEVDNPAVKFYRSHGFEIVNKVGNAWTMAANTQGKGRK